jgi:chemosensory pili system protein ChpA (sensor histidine kinase/response regulator)
MMPSLDAAAIAAFTDEFRLSLPAIRLAMEHARQNRVDLAQAREAHRLIHSLKGAASMVGLAAFGYLLNELETHIEQAIAAKAPLGDHTFEITAYTLPRLQGYMDALLARRSALQVLWELIEIEAREIALPPIEPETTPAALPHVVAAPDALAELPLAPPPAPVLEPGFEVVPSTPVPPELAEIFSLEAQEHLDTIAKVTAALSPEQQDSAAVQELRRSVHTLKGAAGVVGYIGASKLAHRMEDLLDRLYEGTATLTAPAVRTLASSSDALHDMIGGSQEVEKLQAMVLRLFSEYDRLMGDVPAMPAGSAQSTSAESTSAGLVSLDTTPAIVPTIDRRRRQGDRRGSGPTLRVPVGRLNELLRVVSEIVINRSTFEQHHLALIEQVDELKLSTARLRRVTHKLESDYEVRALGGNMSMIGPGTGRDAGSAGGHGFDDLEFDRYTEFHLLTRELTEITSDIATIGTRVGGTIGDFDSDLTRLGRLTRDIQDKAMEFRMVALGTMTAQLERAVRQTGEMCGKPVDFSLEGEHVSLDKSLLEQMSEPLLHLLRNAVDHGIESPEHRAFAAKPASGRITVRAFHEGTDVVIEVEDDGAGLDAERIKATAIARGLLDESTAAALGADALFALIFEPGFSTAVRIKAKVTRLGGRVYLSSKPGAGTTVSVRVPMTLAITRILLVRSGGEVFGLPLASVIQIARPHPSALGKVGAERVCTLDGKTYPLWDLAETLGLPKSVETTASQPVLIANLSRRRIALAVDEIINSRDAVVKTLGTHLRRVPGIWGATLLGDGTVVLILNPADLAGSAESPVVVRRPVAVSREREPYHVLVVDDSLSMRHVLSVAVKKAGWVPVPARDGLEALDLLQRHPHPPDLVLLDIEMPRMDGFEFLSTVRSQKGRADLPIVMLTSRSGEKHRDKAGALGATDYMVKPFQEDALIRNIARLIQASRLTARRAS